MANQAAQTAFGPMLAIAVEQNYPAGQRLVQDELASRFLPPVFRFFAKLTRLPPARALLFNFIEKRARGVWGGVLCRKRYIDDKLLEAVRAGSEAVVILGAGLDTRPYRLPALASTPVFETDLPENSEYKKARLQRIFGSLPAQVNFVPVDLDRQDLAGVLASYGYRAAGKSFFILEAVTQYLSEDGIQNTFRMLAQAETGSRLVFTYICKDFIDGTIDYGLDALYQTYRVRRLLWRFGLEPSQVAAFLGQYGWKEIEQVGSREYAHRYLEPIQRLIPVMEIERAVYAERV